MRLAGTVQIHDTELWENQGETELKCFTHLKKRLEGRQLLIESKKEVQGVGNRMKGTVEESWKRKRRMKMEGRKKRKRVRGCKDNKQKSEYNKRLLRRETHLT